MCFERKVDKEAFGHFYKQGYVSGHMTLFDKIRKLTIVKSFNMIL